MRQFFSVIAFTVLMVAFFAGYSNFGIPQIEPAPPPKQEKLDLSAMTMDQFVALGERIFNGKGTCTLCHNELGRAPMLDTVAAVAKDRFADERYKGEAEDSAGYLMESMVTPSAFVVAGFGKKGSNDTVSPMPNVSTGSVGLNDAELKAVVAYLQDRSGLEVTVQIPSGVAEEAESEASEARKMITDPEEAVSEFACGACHKVAGEEGEVGPDLTHIGSRRDRAFLRKSILSPNADIAEGYEPDQMPADYGQQMFAAEIEMLLDYLAELK